MMANRQTGMENSQQRNSDVYFIETTISNRTRIEGLEGFVKDLKDTLKEIQKDMHEMRKDIQDIRAKARGGWLVLAAIGTSLVGLFSIANSIWGMLKNGT